MNNERFGDLLMQIGAGDRTAFHALYQEAGPTVAAHLSASGVPQSSASDAVVDAYSKVWSGDYALPIQFGEPLIDWLAGFAKAQTSIVSKAIEPPVPIDDTLWKRITAAAYPESPRNIIKRLDVLFALGAALTWAVLLWLLTPR